jgi:hypothetical protein
LAGVAVAFGTASSLLAFGCSSETTNVLGDDSGTVSDRTTAPDTRQETGPVEDAGTDVFVSDAAVDAPPAALFGAQVVAAICARIQACCGVDAGPFDTALCRTKVAEFNGIWGEVYGAEFADGGRVVYNQLQAAQCLAEVNNLNCTNVTAAAFLAGRSSCLGALIGSGGIGAPCRNAIECAPGSFCLLPVDGGVGSCQALRGDGGACGDFGAPPDTDRGSHTACSYRGNGATGLACDVVDYDSGAFLPTNQWFCRPARDAGAPCYVNQDCKDGICGDNAECATSSYLTSQAVCDSYRITDAGGGG